MGSQASSTLFRELWGDQTINALIRKQKSVQRVFNAVRDYTSFVKNKSAAGYHGPKITGLAGETVSRGSGFGSVQSATNTSIDIDFNQKSGGAFDIVMEEGMQTNIDLVKEYGEEMADEIMDEYDNYILTAMVNGAASDQQVDFDYAATTVDLLTADDFQSARKALNLAGAPQSNRFCFVSPKHESQLYDISNFISRDKIPDTTALRDGVVGKIMGFQVILTDQLPQVSADGTIDGDTAANNDSYPVLFTQKDAYGWGRQKELETMESRDAQNTTTDYALWSMHGGAVQMQDYIYQISDQTTADPA